MRSEFGYDVKDPIEIFWCAWNQGHYWVRINPYWLRKKDRSRTDTPKYCPEHYRKGRGRALRKNRRKAVKAYNILPLPLTKLCNDVKCTHNGPQPSENFYIVKRKLKYGIVHHSLYAYCKECTKRKTKDNWASLSEEEKKKRNQEYGEKYREAHPEVVAAYRQQYDEDRRKAREDRNKLIPLPVTSKFIAWLNMQDIPRLAAQLEVDDASIDKIKTRKTITLNKADKLILAASNGVKLEHFWTEEELTHGVSRHM